MIDWSTVKALSFDCYGTLVDWEAGILRDVKANFVTRTGKPASVLHDDDQILRFFAQGEPAAQAGPYKGYREVLKTTALRISDAGHLKLAEPEVFAHGIATWPVFPDTQEGLRRLKDRFKLAVVTNADRDIFSGTEPQLGVTFDVVVTSDVVHSYKPARKHFEETIARLGGDPASIVHVASSLFHDIEPAMAMGLRTARIDRRGGRSGGATQRPTTPTTANLTVKSLAELVTAIGPL